MNLLPPLAFWLLAAWGAASRRPVLLYLFFTTMPFGAFAVIPPTITGGLTFTPAPIIALLLVARAFGGNGGPAALLSLAARPQRLLLLTLFWLVAGVTTLFMPRLFAGGAMVIPFRGFTRTPVTLQPSLQNISQFAYLTIAVLSVFAFARLLRSAAMRQHALAALCLGGAVTAATGLLDHATRFLPLEPLLAPFRTASYALLTGVEVLGTKRVVGLMPEASAYGGLCLALLSTLYFQRRAMANRRLRTRQAPIVIALLALCAWLSTSSAAYLGLGVLALVAMLDWALRVNARRPESILAESTQAGRELTGEMAIITALATVLALIALVRPDVFRPVLSLIQRMVLDKQFSASFAERAMWRDTALRALWSTGGLGLGLGATRASSSVVAVLAATGLAGGVLFHGFLLKCLLRRPARKPADARVMQSAFRLSFIPPFAVSLVVGDANFSGVMAFGLGLSIALGGTFASRRGIIRPVRRKGLPPPSGQPQRHEQYQPYRP